MGVTATCRIKDSTKQFVTNRLIWKSASCHLQNRHTSLQTYHQNKIVL